MQYAPFGAAPFKKISKNVDFSLWGNRATTQTHIFWHFHVRPKSWKSHIVPSCSVYLLPSHINLTFLAIKKLIEKLFFWKRTQERNTERPSQDRLLYQLPPAWQQSHQIHLLRFWGSSIGSSFLRYLYNAGCKVWKVYIYIHTLSITCPQYYLSYNLHIQGRRNRFE